MTVVCRATGCGDDAVTEHLDGAGQSLALCDHHGDQLAVGFPIDPPAKD